MVQNLTKLEKAFIFAQSLIESIFEASLRTELVIVFLVITGALLSISLPVLGFVLGTIGLLGIFTAASYKTRRNDFNSKLQTLNDIDGTFEKQIESEMSAQKDLEKTLTSLSSGFIANYRKQPNKLHDKNIFPIKQLLLTQQKKTPTKKPIENYLNSKKIKSTHKHGRGYDQQYMDSTTKTFIGKSIVGTLLTSISMLALGLALPTVVPFVPLLLAGAAAGLIAGITYGLCHILIRKKNNAFINQFKETWDKVDLSQQKENALRDVNQDLLTANKTFLEQENKTLQTKLTDTPQKTPEKKPINRPANNFKPTKPNLTSDKSNILIGQHRPVYHKDDFFDHQKHSMMNYNNHCHLLIETAGHPVNKNELIPHSFVLSQSNHCIQLQLYEAPHQEPVNIAIASINNLQPQLAMLPKSLENVSPEQQKVLKDTIGSWYQTHYPYLEHRSAHSAPQLSTVHNEIQGNTALQPEHH